MKSSLSEEASKTGLWCARIYTNSIAPYAFLAVMHGQQGLGSHGKRIVSIIHDISYLNLLTKLQKLLHIIYNHMQ